MSRCLSSAFLSVLLFIPSAAIVSTENCLASHPNAIANFPANSSLLRAVSSGDLPGVKKALKTGANPSAFSELGDHAVNLAASGGHSLICQVLINAGADIDAVGSDGKTALMTASESGNFGLVSMLLLHKASVLKLSTFHESALLLACRNGDPRCIQALFWAGADVKVADSDGETPLEEAAKAVAWNRAPLMVKLLVKDSIVDHVDKRGRTALMMAAGAHSPEAIKYLLEADAHSALKDDTGRTALLYAVQNITPTSKAGKSSNTLPLNKNEENQREEDVTSFLTFALGNHASDILKAVQVAAAVGNVSAMHGFVDAKVDINQPGGLDFLSFVPDFANRADQLKAEWNDKVTPLMIASACGKAETVKFLLANHANPAARDSEGRTSIMYAARFGRFDTAQILIERGVDVDAADKNGERALMYVAELGAFGYLGKSQPSNGDAPAKRIDLQNDDRKLVELFVSAGADTDAKNVKGETALDLAQKSGNSAVTDTLKNLDSKK